MLGLTSTFCGINDTIYAGHGGMLDTREDRGTDYRAYNWSNKKADDSWVTEPGITRHRPLDYILCVYYISQAIGTTFFDTQGVYPEWMYPSWLRAPYNYYVVTFHDPFLDNAWKFPWYLSVCLVEHSLGIPFFIWACYCYHFGAMNRPHIIFPSVIWCTFTIAGVIAVWSMALLEDFSTYDGPAPQTPTHRVVLCAMYSPMLIFSFINLVDSYILALDVIFRPIE